jgi:hypothetical protein
MKIDKRLLIAGLTVAIAAFGLMSTASASAAVWKMGGTNVTKLVEIGLSGGEVAEWEEKGVSCEIKLTMTTEGGSTGKITKFENTSCTTFGKISTCTVASTKAEGLPWTVTVDATDLTIKNWRVKRTFNAGCGTTSIDKTIPSTTFTLLSPTAISEIEFLGELKEAEVLKYKAFGSLTVDSPNSGTYGIG